MDGAACGRSMNEMTFRKGTQFPAYGDHGPAGCPARTPTTHRKTASDRTQALRIASRALLPPVDAPTEGRTVPMCEECERNAAVLCCRCLPRLGW